MKDVVVLNYIFMFYWIYVIYQYNFTNLKPQQIENN
jgi:hypothetical protein